MYPFAHCQDYVHILHTHVTMNVTVSYLAL